MKPENALARYLADDLTPQEAAELERAAIVDPDAFEALLLDEADLLDDYARGTGDPAVRRAVEERMRTSATFRERVELAALLAETADGQGASDATGSAVGWQVLAGLSGLFLALSLAWLVWGVSTPGSQMPLFLLGFLAWISLCGVVVSSLRWHAARERLRRRLDGLEELLAESEKAASGGREDRVASS